MTRIAGASLTLALLTALAGCSPDPAGSLAPEPAAAPSAPGAGSEPEASRLPLAAIVLGEEVRTRDAEQMQQIVLTRLFDRYAGRQAIAVSDQEIADYVDRLRRGLRDGGLTAEDGLTPVEASQVDQMRREMARSMIRQWKLNRSLYQQYGGRIAYQQLGPEPLDAYRRFLEERQAAGDFSLVNEAFRDDFWRYFTDESRHDFYAPGSDEEARAFTRPPWEQPVADSGLPGEATQAAAPGTAGILAGTRWRLVRFQSMDDAIGDIEPEDPSVYTLSLNADGTLQMQLNCNRATGTWKAEPAGDRISGQFSFGPLATTRALCPPPSMDERIARDAQWVRGYLLRDGQLNLSLMADGGIYTWAPEPPGE